MTKQRRIFSSEFKSDAVQRCEGAGRTLTQVARELNVHPSLLQTWRRKSRATVAGTTRAPDAAPTSLDEEVRRLRRENAELREDRDILKKAATFFAKQSR